MRVPVEVIPTLERIKIEGYAKAQTWKVNFYKIILACCVFISRTDIRKRIFKMCVLQFAETQD